MNILLYLKHGFARFLELMENVLTASPFSGSYSSWNEAHKVSSGYHSPVIFEKVLRASLKVKNGLATYERDSVSFSKIEYSWPTLAALLWIASQNRNNLNLVDFGGAFGSSYYQNRYFLTHLNELRWNIVEQQHFVERGKLEFENEHIRFYLDLSECYELEKPQVILCSSVVHYLESPYHFIDKVASLGFKYIIIDRMPFISTGKDKITIQKVPPQIYNATIPCWLLNVNNFKTCLNQQYELIIEFDGFEKISAKNIAFKGFVFQKRV